MSEDQEIKALMQELERLAGEAQTASPEALIANNARQAEIRERLTALGRPVG